MVITVDFSSDAPSQAELLAHAHRAARRERIPADLDLDRETLHLTVSGGPEDVRAVLDYLVSQGCTGEVLIEFFHTDERDAFGSLEFPGIAVEVLTWNPERSAIPKVEVCG